ncbi:PPE family protein [Mycobacterium decipiens]|uniref:PPE family protein n=1 Tax=Mycobacterium decipiens TaxID=1430326 RepID=A0A1X2LZR4_9MYCO|nr:PPE family protein [Mycobacterium decipiens]OSC42724.1 hypothetical protein B8W66_04105 [Mycobacterium decipiens]
MDFGALPPEVNSARIYSGPGSAPLMQAAAAWERLANELNSTAASYSLVVSGLTGDEWLGPSALSMAAAAVPYVAWMRATAASAEQAAAQAVAAAYAYESAYAATVPPAVIAANRSTMMSLIQTNIFGQNTPAIATSEAQYGEMWAQDIVAMEGYAGTSAAASELTPFTPPPATTTGAGLPGEAVASAALAAAPAETSVLPTLQSFLPPPLNQIPNPFEDLDLLVAAAVAVSAGALGLSGVQLGEVYRHDLIDEAEKAPNSMTESDENPPEGQGSRPAPGRAGPSNPGGGRLITPPQPPIAALSGYSANIGGLSVPHSWNLPPAVRQVAAMFPGATPMYMTGGSDGSYAGLAAAGLAGTALAGLAARGGSSPTPAAAAPAAGGGTGAAATRPAAENTPAVPAAAAGVGIPGLPPGLPPGVVANLAATLAAIPGATIIVVPPSPNTNQ